MYAGAYIGVEVHWGAPFWWVVALRLSANLGWPVVVRSSKSSMSYHGGLLSRRANEEREQERIAHIATHVGYDWGIESHSHVARMVSGRELHGPVVA